MTVANKQRKSLLLIILLFQFGFNKPSLPINLYDILFN
jgi:hypothetical protein